MKISLVPGWQKFYKFWSVQLGVLGTFLTGLFVTTPEAALFVWNNLPQDLKDTIPPSWTALIGPIIFLLSIVARLITQQKLKAEVAAKQIAEREGFGKEEEKALAKAIHKENTQAPPSIEED